MTTPTIQSQLMLLHSSDGMVDLYKLDTSPSGGAIYWFSPQCYQDGTLVSFGGQSYDCFPIGIDTLETHATSAALPQPTLTVSNVGGTLMSAIAGQNDLIGSKLTHWKTKASYLDAGANPDSAAFIGPQIWYLFQKSAHNANFVQFKLVCPIDRPGLQFPVRQVMKSPGVCPGQPGQTLTFNLVSSSGSNITLGAMSSIVNPLNSQVVVVSGTGAFAPGTYITGLVSGTTYAVTPAPTTPLVDATIYVFQPLYFPGVQPYQSQY